MHAHVWKLLQAAYLRRAALLVHVCHPCIHRARWVKLSPPNALAPDLDGCCCQAGDKAQHKQKMPPGTWQRQGWTGSPLVQKLVPLLVPLPLDAVQQPSEDISCICGCLIEECQSMRSEVIQNDTYQPSPSLRRAFGLNVPIVMKEPACGRDIDMAAMNGLNTECCDRVQNERGDHED